MKKHGLLIANLLLLQNLTAHAAYKSLPIQNKLTTYVDGRPTTSWPSSSYSFRVEVIGDSDGLKPESQKNGRPFIEAKNGERYAVRLYNPLPVRVAVNLTVDGLNSLTGKPSGISDGQKWLIEPYSTIVIRGWQVGQNEARRFFFTDKPKSYAEWRGEMIQQNLSANCGVIGAAFFWNKAELQTYFDRNPRYVTTPRPAVPMCQKTMGKSENLFRRSYEAAGAASGVGTRSAFEADAPKEKQEAGTGMGERESHATQLVDFHYDDGMYTVAKAVLIYYDFAKPSVPNPFPNLSYAPEMP